MINFEINTEDIINEALEVITDEIGARPIGTENNRKANHFLKMKALQMGYDVISLPIECFLWEKDKSYMSHSVNSLEVFPSPFSEPFEGTGKVKYINSVEQLEWNDCNDRIIILHGDITKESMMPKDFPFFYPDEHKKIIELLEKKNIKGIIALTGKHPMCGLNPFPFFEDGNILIPSCFISEKYKAQLPEEGEEIFLKIASGKEYGNGKQLVIKREGNKKRKIIISAHMDSKYETPAALDNGSGISVLLGIMHLLKDFHSQYELHFVPFNGEEYYGVPGQLGYLEYLNNEYENLELVINIDSPGHFESKTALSFYNIPEEEKKRITDKIERSEYLTTGQEWYAGDHSMFVFKGVPAIAVTSSNLFGKVLELTHSAKDVRRNIDEELLGKTAEYLAELIRNHK